MLAVVMSLAMVASTDSAPAFRPAPSLKNQPSRICRELSGASSRSEAIKICRTRAEWLKWNDCHGATRYCAPKAGLPGRPTAFELNEDARIICRKLAVTGTRLKAVNTCMAKREWDRMWEDSAEGTRRLQDFSKRSVSGIDR